jgi:hypothetical protein
MADQPKIILYEEFEGTAYSALISAKIAAANDTVTMSDFVTITTAVGFRKDTGAAIAVTLLNNVITVTTSLTGVQILILLWGSRT